MTTQQTGTIIKTPDQAPGLLIVAGQQKSFTLEGIWKSPLAPAVNMAVDVEFDDGGSILGLTAVDPQQAAKEKLNQLGGVAQQHGKEAAEIARQGVGALVARMGKVTLAAAVIHAIAWFFMPALTIGQNFSPAPRSFTLWDLVGLDPNTSLEATPANHGLFALLGLLAIAAPFAAPFLRNPKAKLLYATPLVYLVTAVFVICYDLNELFRHFYSSFDKAMQFLGFSLGIGTPVLIIACLALAVQVLRNPSGASTGSVARPPTAVAVSSPSGFCTKCGKPLNVRGEFCTECGARRT
jgi:hypothetical protein